jgi:hypothetical protein
MHTLGLALGSLALAVGLGQPLVAQSSTRRTVLERELDQYRARRCYLAGQRHLEYGLELREKGLTTQAAAQIVRAVEVSEGQNFGALRVLSIMRDLDDRFWKRKVEKPAAARVAAYAKRARELERADQKDRLDLGLWAWTKGLEEEAKFELRALLCEVDAPLVSDSSGAIVLPVGKILKKPSQAILAEAVSINGQLYLRDAFLAHLPDLQELFEVSTSELRVRSTNSVDEAQALHTLLGALLPILTDDLGGSLTRRPQLVVLGTRALYEAYLTDAGLTNHWKADGFADQRAFTAAVCAEGTSVPDLQAIALHELVHLFQFGLSPAVMPSWYVEGLAETYGGQGTFAWDGARLVTGGRMSDFRLADLRGAGKPFPLAELLELEGSAVLQDDPASGWRFYAQSWAFVRYLRKVAPEEVRSRFLLWEAQCLGTAAGAEVGQANRFDRRASQELFRAALGDELTRIEADFAAWLAKL